MFAVKPPPTGMMAPGTNLASAKHRKKTAAATSSGLPTRPIGCAAPSAAWRANGR